MDVDWGHNKILYIYDIYIYDIYIYDIYIYMIYDHIFYIYMIYFTYMGFVVLVCGISFFDSDDLIWSLYLFLIFQHGELLN